MNKNLPDCTCDTVPDTARDVPMRKDPLRISWDTHFKEVFGDVAIAVGFVIDRRAIPNRYHNDCTCSEPWWQFEIGNKTFVVGPRKRVINIQVESKEPFDPAPLKALSDRDGVTFDSRPLWYDATEARAKDIPHNHDFSTAIFAVEKEEQAKFTGREHFTCKAYIHAWTKCKCVEYLIAAMKLATE